METPYPPAAGLNGQRCRVIRAWVQFVECPSRGDFVIPVHTQKRCRFPGTERDCEPVEGGGQAFTDGLYVRLLPGPARKERFPADVIPGQRAQQDHLFRREESIRNPFIGQIGADAFDVDADIGPARDRKERKAIGVRQVEPDLEAAAAALPHKKRLALGTVPEAHLAGVPTEVAAENDPQQRTGHDEVLLVS